MFSARKYKSKREGHALGLQDEVARWWQPKNDMIWVATQYANCPGGWQDLIDNPTRVVR